VPHQVEWWEQVFLALYLVNAKCKIDYQLGSKSITGYDQRGWVGWQLDSGWGGWSL